MRSIVTLIPFSLVLLAVASASAAPPPPPPKFWSVSRCEQTLHAHDYLIPTADGHYFHVGLRVCVGTGGPHACEWTSEQRSRLYSQFSVFTRSRYIAASFARGRSPHAPATASSGSGITPATSTSDGQPTSSCRQLASICSQAMPPRNASAQSSRRSRPALRNDRTRPAVQADSRRSRGRTRTLRARQRSNASPVRAFTDLSHADGSV
jgi:hypothetical protein